MDSLGLVADARCACGLLVGVWPLFVAAVSGWRVCGRFSASLLLPLSLFGVAGCRFFVGFWPDFLEIWIFRIFGCAGVAGQVELDGLKSFSPSWTKVV